MADDPEKAASGSESGSDDGSDSSSDSGHDAGAEQDKAAENVQADENVDKEEEDDAEEDADAAPEEQTATKAGSDGGSSKHSGSGSGSGSDSGSDSEHDGEAAADGDTQIAAGPADTEVVATSEAATSNVLGLDDTDGFHVEDEADDVVVVDEEDVQPTKDADDTAEASDKDDAGKGDADATAAEEEADGAAAEGPDAAIEKPTGDDETTADTAAADATADNASKSGSGSSSDDSSDDDSDGEDGEAKQKEQNEAESEDEKREDSESSVEIVVRGGGDGASAQKTKRRQSESSSDEEEDENVAAPVAAAVPDELKEMDDVAKVDIRDLKPERIDGISIEPDPNFEQYVSPKERKRLQQEKKEKEAYLKSQAPIKGEMAEFLEILQALGPPDLTYFNKTKKRHGKRLQAFCEKHQWTDVELGRRLCELFQAKAVHDPMELAAEPEVVEVHGDEDNLETAQQHLAEIKEEIARKKAQFEYEIKKASEQAFERGREEGLHGEY